MTSRSLIGVTAVWLTLVGAGSYAIYRYETTAGTTALAGPAWPASSALARSVDRYTVVMFAHPACGCTAASLAELEVMVAEADELPDVVVVFTGDGEPGTALEASDNWQAAGRIPGAHRLRDPGHEAHRFGARTSGHVMIYDPGGTLRFSGGITAARGHAGDNAGRRAAQDALAGVTAAAVHGVFGCSLEDAS